MNSKTPARAGRFKAVVQRRPLRPGQPDRASRGRAGPAC
jgi:hypothetical protein